MIIHVEVYGHKYFIICLHIAGKGGRPAKKMKLLILKKGVKM